jgi:hypothetical protein
MIDNLPSATATGYSMRASKLLQPMLYGRIEETLASERALGDRNISPRESARWTFDHFEGNLSLQRSDGNIHDRACVGACEQNARSCMRPTPEASESFAVQKMKP